MKILLTNDDGADSPFLRPLAEALAALGAVTVVAPDSEKSWIGKGISRHARVAEKRLPGLGPAAWALSGTPADCVNIALRHHCESPPDLVVSGINIGHNTSLVYILSSGTIAGALEGALHGVPAIAVSLGLPREVYLGLKEGDPQTAQEAAAVAASAARRVAAEAPRLLEGADDPYAKVHSLNFPYAEADGLEIAPTLPSPSGASCLFARDGAGFAFQTAELGKRPCDGYTDRQCLHDGKISYSLLDFAKIGVPALPR